MDQVEILIARSADLASSLGIGLVDAVQRTSSAIRGEAESAEVLGLSLSDTVLATEAAARGLDGWRTTMTEAEKAQFRFTLFLEQSTHAQGAARVPEGRHGRRSSVARAGPNPWRYRRTRWSIPSSRLASSGPTQSTASA